MREKKDGQKGANEKEDVIAALDQDVTSTAA